MDLDGVPGELIGPAPERMRYASDTDRHDHLAEFWLWVESFVVSHPGGYDDVPLAFREEGTDSLMAVRP